MRRKMTPDRRSAAAPGAVQFNVNPTILSDPRGEAREFVRRQLFGVFAAASVAGCGLAASNASIGAPVRTALALGFAIVGLFCLVAWRRPALRTDAAVAFACTSGLALVAL